MAGLTKDVTVAWRMWMRVDATITRCLYKRKFMLQMFSVLWQNKCINKHLHATSRMYPVWTVNYINNCFQNQDGSLMDSGPSKLLGFPSSSSYWHFILKTMFPLAMTLETNKRADREWKFIEGIFVLYDSRSIIIDKQLHIPKFLLFD